jgi:hypothetical protein
MPKKIGENPLTKAEVMARYRAKKKAAGFKEKFRWVNTQENEIKIDDDDEKIDAAVKKRAEGAILFLLRVMKIEAKNRPALSKAVEFVSSEFIPKYYPDLIGRK